MGKATAGVAGLVQQDECRLLPLARQSLIHDGHETIMTQATIFLIVLLSFCGCTIGLVSSDAQGLSAGYHRFGAPSLTQEEARAVSVARNYLEKRGGEWIEAYYRPRKAKNNAGYYVDLSFLVSDAAGAKPRVVGPFSSVRISEDWQKVDYIRW